MMRIVLKGIIFGMILQLAIGPVCIFILQTSIRDGFIVAIAGVLGITIVDAVEMLLATVGISKLLEYKRRQLILTLIGVSILLIYGIYMIISVFYSNNVYEFSLYSGYLSKKEGTFICAIILTLSNPLTILFWGGVFSAKIAERELFIADIKWFCLGCIMATVLFLTIVAAVGSFVGLYVNDTISRMLNLGVGVFMIIYGIHILTKKYF